MLKLIFDDSAIKTATRASNRKLANVMVFDSLAIIGLSRKSSAR
ncbi:MAG: hypothetical protein O6649_06305 [Gammaproteobacteria bacterium]|nr:hypothetical protein [Gammaproteobacteria bacterium]